MPNTTTLQLPQFIHFVQFDFRKKRTSYLWVCAYSNADLPGPKIGTIDDVPIQLPSWRIKRRVVRRYRSHNSRSDSSMWISNGSSPVQRAFHAYRKGWITFQVQWTRRHVTCGFASSHQQWCWRRWLLRAASWAFDLRSQAVKAPDLHARCGFVDMPWLTLLPGLQHWTYTRSVIALLDRQNIPCCSFRLVV